MRQSQSLLIRMRMSTSNSKHSTCSFLYKK